MFTQIDKINEIADLAVEKYEEGNSYYYIRNIVGSKYHIYLSSEFIAYLIHGYMKIAKRDENENQNKKSM